MAEYNQLTPELIAELENIVGGDNCLTGEDINEDYAHDEMPIYGMHMPDIVVLPANTDEVSAIMKLASANNIPVTVRGPMYPADNASRMSGTLQRRTADCQPRMEETATNRKRIQPHIDNRPRR